MDIHRRLRLLEHKVRFLESLMLPKTTSKRTITRSSPEPFEIILNIVSRICDVERKRILRKGRGKQDAAWARQLIMYFSIEYKLGSGDYIAECLNREDHATVLYGYDRVVAIASLPGKDKDQFEACKQEIDTAFNQRAGMLVVAS